MAQSTLKVFGYNTELCKDGESALSSICDARMPVLALIDWLMPGMNGVAICKRIYQNPPAHPVHTIIMTSRDSNKDKAYALESGADDFIAKPFDPQVLRARVRVGIRLLSTIVQHRESNSRLLEYTKKIETMAEERASQLLHADRLSTIGTLSAGIAHEINNPASFISVNISTIRKNAAALMRILDDNGDKKEHARARLFLESLPEIVDEMDNGVARIREIVHGLKSYVHNGTRSFHPFSINNSIETSLKLCHNHLKYNCKIVKKLDDVPEVYGMPQQIEQVLVNLIINAADAIDTSGREGTIDIHAEYLNGVVTVTIGDNGPGIPEKELGRIFNPFFTTKPVGKGTGLGLSISENIIREHKGAIKASNRPDGGFEFSFTLPAYREKRDR